jgi:hypothetical protein
MPHRVVYLEKTWWEGEDELATIIPIPEAVLMPTRTDLDYARMSIEDLLFWADAWRKYAVVRGLDEQQRADVALIWQTLRNRIKAKKTIVDSDNQ